jgi:hypothetical protein
MTAPLTTPDPTPSAEDAARLLVEGLERLKESRAIFARLYADDPEQVPHLNSLIQITTALQTLQGRPPGS